MTTISNANAELNLEQRSGLVMEVLRDVGLLVLLAGGISLIAGCAPQPSIDDDGPVLRPSRTSSEKEGAYAPVPSEPKGDVAEQPSTPPPSTQTPTEPPRSDVPEPEPTTPSSPTTTMVITNVAFEASSRCIDVPAGKMDPGVTLIAWPCHLADNQRFSLSSNGMLKSHNGNCVDIPAGKDQPILWMCHSGVVGENQTWQYNGKTLRAMGRCLAVRGETVVLETCDGSAAQKWITRSE